MKHYLGFAIRTEEKETGTFFKRKKQEEISCRIRVHADSFAEAQEVLCDKMQVYKMPVAFIFPYTEEDIE
jgi:hypothetical protein